MAAVKCTLYIIRSADYIWFQSFEVKQETYCFSHGCPSVDLCVHLSVTNRVCHCDLYFMIQWFLPSCYYHNSMDLHQTWVIGVGWHFEGHGGLNFMVHCYTSYFSYFFLLIPIILGLKSWTDSVSDLVLIGGQCDLYLRVIDYASCF